MRMTILYTVIHFPQWQLVIMYSMASPPPTPPPPSTASEDKVYLKHFTWGFIKNAAICLNRESYIRESTHARTEAPMHMLCI